MTRKEPAFFLFKRQGPGCGHGGNPGFVLMIQQKTLSHKADFCQILAFLFPWNRRLRTVFPGWQRIPENSKAAPRRL